MSRDSQSDISRTGKGLKSREEWLIDPPKPLETLMDEKRAYRGEKPTAGTRGAADIPVAENG